jgi:hypothetical protein
MMMMMMMMMIVLSPNDYRTNSLPPNEAKCAPVPRGGAAPGKS